MGQFGRMSESAQRIAKPYVLQLPKAGNTPAEYEDAAFVQRSFSGFRLALADGASAAVFAGAWARMLARTFARRPFWTAAALRYRAQKLGQFWRWQHAQLELPWYAEQKLADGAAATLIGVTITLPAQRAAAGSWQSLAVGDACLFQMRDRALVQMHPDLNPAEFGNAPALVPATIGWRGDWQWQLAAGAWATHLCWQAMRWRSGFGRMLRAGRAHCKACMPWLQSPLRSLPSANGRCRSRALGV